MLTVMLNTLLFKLSIVIFTIDNRMRSGELYRLLHPKVLQLLKNLQVK